MSQKNQNPGDKSAPESRGADKKPYQKPAFCYERVFETMALACGKVHANQGQCRFNKKVS